MRSIGSGGEYADSEGAWARLRQIDESGAVLVRPDMHIGWRAITLPQQAEAALSGAFGAILSR